LDLTKRGLSSVPLCPTEAMAGNCLISGWGYIDPKGTLPDQLKRLFQPITDRETCSKNYGGGITKNMICVGGKDGEGGCK